MTPNTAPSIPQTLLRSAPAAQHLWKNAHDRAVKTYGDLGRAQRAAFTALKAEFQKDGDRWIPKNGKKPAIAARAQAAPEKSKATNGRSVGAAKTGLAKAKEAPRKTSSTTTRRRQRKTTNNKTVTRKRSLPRSRK